MILKPPRWLLVLSWKYPFIWLRPFAKMYTFQLDWNLYLRLKHKSIISLYMYKNQNILLFFQVQIKSKMERQTPFKENIEIYKYFFLFLLEYPHNFLKDKTSFVRCSWLSHPINTLPDDWTCVPNLAGI